MDPLELLMHAMTKKRESDEDRDVMSLALQALQEKHSGPASADPA